jgi:3-oxoacyl-[acyl-carrier protein] reductase
MRLGLENKVTLVTASSRGIGLGIARVFTEEGARVIISSRNEEELRKAKEELRKIGGDVDYIKADLTVKEEVDYLVRRIGETHGELHVVVYNTGPPKPGSFMELSDEDWEYGTRLLLLSAVWLTRRAIPLMLRNNWGRLIYVTSLTLRQPMPNLVLSNTIRLSINGLVKSLATELGPRGITVNGIMQGHILTGRVRELAEDTAKRTGRSTEDVMRELTSKIPLGRYGTPEEVGYLAAFLASEKASYINGTMILIDGGVVQCIT